MTIKNKFILDTARSLLVVIDVQERLCAAMNPEVLAQLVRNTGILLDSAQELSVPVIFTEQYVKGLGPTLAELKGKAPAAACHEKLSFSCCGNQDFVRQIRESGRTQIVICGMETHVCVLQTVIDLLDGGLNVHLVSDAVMSRSNDNRQTAIDAMTQAGAVPTGTESVVFQWLKVAGTDSFKKVSKLVK